MRLFNDVRLYALIALAVLCVLILAMCSDRGQKKLSTDSDAVNQNDHSTKESAAGSEPGTQTEVVTDTEASDATESQSSDAKSSESENPNATETEAQSLVAESQPEKLTEVAEAEVETETETVVELSLIHI